jgi:hypothetical protein
MESQEYLVAVDLNHTINALGHYAVKLKKVVDASAKNRGLGAACIILMVTK